TPAASLTLADYYRTVGHYDDARRVLVELASRPDAYVPATVRLALLDRVQGSTAQALSRLQEVFVKEPRDPSAHLLTARLLAADHKGDEPLPPTNAVISFDVSPITTADASQIAGQIYEAVDRIDEAIEAYQQVLKRQARLISAELALARLYL